MTKIIARYSSIGFTGARCERTFVHLATEKGEIRAYLTRPEHETILSSHAIGKTFKVTLGPERTNGHIVEADLHYAVPV